MEYAPYKDYDLYDMINEPRRISKDPYKLHAAFMLSCLFEVCPTDENDRPQNPNDTWGWSVPAGILNDIVKNGNEQFMEACGNGLPIDIWNSQYSIRHSKDIDPSRLKDIFKFSKAENDYVINKSGIMDLAHPLAEEQKSKFEQLRDDRSYLKKIVKMAEDTKDGWYELTDIEVAAYLWYLYKGQTYDGFRQRFKDDLYTTLVDEHQCWNDVMNSNPTAPKTPYIFSADKMRKWNTVHGQHSYVDKVDLQSAEDYWFTKH